MKRTITTLLLASLLVASFGCVESLLTKVLHASSEDLVACGAGLGLADALES